MFLWFWSQVFLRPAITEILEWTVLVSRGLKCLLLSWGSIRAEFTMESRQLSGIDTRSRGVTLSSGAELCWLWLKPRGSIILQWDCVHSSAKPKLISGGRFTSNLPCDNNNIEDLLICSNCRLLTLYYSIWFSVDVHQKHTNMNAFVLKR